MKRIRKFEKVSNNIDSFYKDVKNIHQGMKDEGCPVDIEYSGAFADVLFPSNLLSRFKGSVPKTLATIVWNVTEKKPIAWNMTVFSNGEELGTTNKIDDVIDILVEVYKKFASKKKRKKRV